MKTNPFIAALFMGVFCVNTFMEVKAQSEISEIDRQQRQTIDSFYKINQYNKKTLQRPTTQQQRQIAFYSERHDGSKFIKGSDSLRFFWNGARGGDFNYINTWNRNFLLESEPDILNSLKQKYVNTDSSISYYADNIANKFWPPVGKEESNIDANDNILGSVSYRMDTEWKFDTKRTFTYDDNGIISSIQFEKRVNSVWENFQKLTYTLDGNGNVTQVLSEEWNRLNNFWFNHNLQKFAYDSNNNLLEESIYDWRAGEWANVIKYECEYDNLNNCISFIEQGGYNQSWINVKKNTYTYINNKRSSLITQNWDGSNWKNDIKLGYNYFDNGLCSDVTNYFWFNENWQNGAKTVFHYNASMQFDTVLYQNRLNNTYKSTYRYIFSYTDFNKIRTVETHNLTDAGTTIFQGAVKYNFFYETFEGKPDEDEEEQRSPFAVYPNPANDILHIDGGNEVIKQVTIFNAAGKKVMEQTVAPNQTKTNLKVNILQSGVYFVKTTGATLTKTTKISIR